MRSLVCSGDGLGRGWLRTLLGEKNTSLDTAKHSGVISLGAHWLFSREQLGWDTGFALAVDLNNPDVRKLQHDLVLLVVIVLD